MSPAPSAAPVLELESLFVRIWADATQYFSTVNLVREQTGKLNATIQSIGAAATSVARVVTAAIASVSDAVGAATGVTQTMTATTLGVAEAINSTVLKVSATATTTALSATQTISTLTATAASNVEKATLWITSSVAAMSAGVSAAMAPIGGAFGRLTSFLTAVDNVSKAQFNILVKGMTDLGASLSGIDAAKLKGVSGSLNVMLSGLGGISKQSLTDIRGFFTSLNTMMKNLSVNLATIDVSKLRGVQSLLSVSSFGGLNAQSLKDIRGFFTSLKTMLGNVKDSLDTIDIPKLTQLRLFFRSLVPSFVSLNAGMLTDIRGFMTSFGTLLRNLSVNLQGMDIEKIKGVRGFLGGLSNLFQNMPKSPIRLGSLFSGIEKFIGQIAMISPEDTEKLARLGKVLGSFSGIGRLARIGDLAPVGASLKNMIEGLTKISPEALGILNKLGDSMRGIATASRLAAANGGIIPPIIRAVAADAGGAIEPVGTLTSRLKTFFQNMVQGFGGLDLIRLGVAGFIGFAIYQFAKLDDSITKTLSHMRPIAQDVRKGLEKGIMDLATTTRSSPEDIAKGLDVLASSGMSASMALKALSLSESFAVASGMSVEQSARKQVDILRSLGLMTQDVNHDYAEMKHLSDLLVAVAPLTGSTVEQLSDAMGGRFTAEMRALNISMEDGIALLGAYSRQQVRGAEASDRAARFLMSLNKQNVEGQMQWDRFGVKVFDASGQMRYAGDILADLNSKMAGMSPQAQEAAMDLLGFEYRAKGATLPIMQMAGSMQEFRDEMQKAGGVTEVVANMLRHDFMGQLIILWNNVKGVAFLFGQVLAPAVAYVAERLGDMVKWFKDLNPALRYFIIVSRLAGASLLIIGPLWKAVTWSIGMMGIAVMQSITVLMGFFNVIRMGIVWLAMLPIYLAMGVLWTPFYVGAFLAATAMRAVTLSINLFTGVVGLARTALIFFNSVVGTGSILGRAFWATYSLIRTVLGSLQFTVWGIQSALIGLANAFEATWGFVTSLFSGTGTMFQMFIKNIAMMEQSLVNFLFKIGETIANITLSIMESFASLALNAVAMIATLGVWLVLFSAIGSVVVTIGIGIGQLFMLIVSGLADAWHNAQAGLNQVSEWLQGSASGVMVMWEGAKVAVADYSNTVMGFGDQLVGFFWNFGENVVIIWKWIVRNWKPLMQDFGRLTVMMVENIMTDLNELGLFIKDTGSIAWQGFWATAGAYIGPVFNFMREQWQNILDDMSVIFQKFAQNLGKNFQVVLHAITRLGASAAMIAAIDLQDSIIRGAAGGGVGSQAMPLEEMNRRLAINQKRRDEITDPIMKDMFDEFLKMGGPFDGLDKSQFKTDFGRQGGTIMDIIKQGRLGQLSQKEYENLIGPDAMGHVGLMGDPRTMIPSTGIFKAFSEANAGASLIMQGVGGDIGKRFKEAQDKLKTPVQDFVSSITEPLNLNLTKPPDWTNKLAEWMSGESGAPGSKADSGEFAGKQGPGFTFKQVSMNRFMVGGDVARSLEYEQLVSLRLLGSKMDKLIAVEEGKMPVMLPSPLRK